MREFTLPRRASPAPWSPFRVLLMERCCFVGGAGGAVVGWAGVEERVELGG